MGSRHKKARNLLEQDSGRGKRYANAERTPKTKKCTPTRYGALDISCQVLSVQTPAMTTCSNGYSVVCQRRTSGTCIPVHYGSIGSVSLLAKPGTVCPSDFREGIE